MTLYRNFSSKDELVLAFPRRREEIWTNGWLRAEVTRREPPRGSGRWPSSADMADPDGLPGRHILVKGSIIAAGEGETDAANWARELGLLLRERGLTD